MFMRARAAPSRRQRQRPRARCAPARRPPWRPRAPARPPRQPARPPRAGPPARRSPARRPPRPGRRRPGAARARRRRSARRPARRPPRAPPRPAPRAPGVAHGARSVLRFVAWLGCAPGRAVLQARLRCSFADCWAALQVGLCCRARPQALSERAAPLRLLGGACQAAARPARRGHLAQVTVFDAAGRRCTMERPRTARGLACSAPCHTGESAASWSLCFTTEHAGPERRAPRCAPGCAAPPPARRWRAAR